MEEEAMHIKGTQRLGMEIETLKVVLYSVARKSGNYEKA
jgi:hypothetical protein